jgi:outer membrane protein assembly factor BamA
MPIVHRPFVRFAAWLPAFWLLCASPLAAQSGFSGEPPRVVAVRVVAESGAVLEQNPSKLTIQPGQPFSIEAESASLRELFRSGRYADLRAELADVPGGVRLDFVVRQNLYINRVQIEGLREPPGDALALSALRLNVGDPFRESARKEALDRLRILTRSRWTFWCAWRPVPGRGSEQLPSKTKRSFPTQSCEAM